MRQAFAKRLLSEIEIEGLMVAFEIIKETCYPYFIGHLRQPNHRVLVHCNYIHVNCNPAKV